MTSAILSVMIPVAIDSETFTSSTATEADYTAWNSGTTYAIGDRCISTTTHRIYESALASNTNHDPDDLNNQVGQFVWWIDVSATNRWKMFDGENSSATVNATSLTVVLEPGFISSGYFGGLIGDTLAVTVKDAPGGSTVYSETVTLETSYPPDWYEYFFSPFVQLRDVVLQDIPPYLTCEVTCTLTIGAGNVECGMLQVGDLRPLGTTQYNALAIPKTYSYVGIDDFGNNEIKRRKSARDMSLTAYVTLDTADNVVDLMTQVIDTPVVWVATTDPRFAALRCFGLGKGQLSYDNKGTCFLKLDVTGLI